jgi:hypothetical protein
MLDCLLRDPVAGHALENTRVILDLALMGTGRMM